MRFVIIFCAWLASLSMPAAAERGAYQPPRHDDGHPNFEGIWINTNATPLVRPPGYEQLIISEAQARELDRRRIARDEDRTTPTEPTEWTDERYIERVSGTFRSSIVIDPSDGQIPGNEAFRQRVAAVPAAILHAMDGPEQRPSSERCLGSHATQPPILSIATDNQHLIVQTAQTVVFFSEWLHEARVIRMNAKHAHPAMTSWLGDAIGWWEGDTLVVETRYFTPSDKVRGSPAGIFLVSPATTVTERFTRVSERPALAGGCLPRRKLQRAFHARGGAVVGGGVDALRRLLRRPTQPPEHRLLNRELIAAVELYPRLRDLALHCLQPALDQLLILHVSQIRESQH